MTSSGGIENRAAFDFIRYANCWEDPELLLGACDLVNATCLSVASAGDNSFSLLTQHPKQVVAFDINPIQLAVCELKKVAFQNLEYEEFLGFLGFRESDSRWFTFKSKIAEKMSLAVRQYFDANTAIIVQGVVNGGKFEAYFRLFRKYILPFVHSPKNVRSLLAEKSLGEQKLFFSNVWNNRRYRLLFRLFFNRRVMGRLGRDPEFFRYVEGGSISSILAKRAERAFTEVPTHKNPYLRYIVTGSFGETLPHYARQENFNSIRENLGALEFLHGSIADAASQCSSGFTFFNLSDIFEYMNPRLFSECAKDILNCATRGARVAYYNMLVPRSLHGIDSARFVHKAELSQALFAKNQAFFYGAYHIDEITEVER